MGVREVNQWALIMMRPSLLFSIFLNQHRYPILRLNQYLFKSMSTGFLFFFKKKINK